MRKPARESQGEDNDATVRLLMRVARDELRTAAPGHRELRALRAAGLVEVVGGRPVLSVKGARLLSRAISAQVATRDAG